MTEKLHRKISYKCFRAFIACILKLGFNLKVEYAALPQLPCLFAGNHSSFLDGPIVMMLSPQRVHFLADDKVRNWFLVGMVMDIMGAIFIPQTRPKRALLKMIAFAQAQKTICIFPEGKLTTNGQMNEFNPGIIYISQKTGLPIVPFYIMGAYQAWPWGQKYPRWYPVTVNVGKAIRPDELPKDVEEAVCILKRKIQELSQ